MRSKSVMDKPVNLMLTCLILASLPPHHWLILQWAMMCMNYTASNDHLDVFRPCRTVKDKRKYDDYGIYPMRHCKSFDSKLSCLHFIFWSIARAKKSDLDIISRSFSLPEFIFHTKFLSWLENCENEQESLKRLFSGRMATRGEWKKAEEKKWKEYS
jgi:hypothetical protein